MDLYVAVFRVGKLYFIHKYFLYSGLKVLGKYNFEMTCHLLVENTELVDDDIIIVERLFAPGHKVGFLTREECLSSLENFEIFKAAKYVTNKERKKWGDKYALCIV